jgi:hypothetical protein
MRPPTSTKPSVSRLSAARQRVTPASVSALAGVLVVLYMLVVLVAPPPVPSAQCASPSLPRHRGDCQAAGGPRRPKWDCPSAMRAALPEFRALYKKRVVKDNAGGMLMDHSFALYYTLRSVQPKVVIENGAFLGQSTWIIRMVVPRARIFSVDPKPQARDLPGVTYITGRKFRDFSSIDWEKEYGVNPADALVFFDDHQSGVRRMQEAKDKGFKSASLSMRQFLSPLRCAQGALSYRLYSRLLNF